MTRCALELYDDGFVTSFRIEPFLPGFFSITPVARDDEDRAYTAVDSMKSFRQGRKMRIVPLRSTAPQPRQITAEEAAILTGGRRLTEEELGRFAPQPYTRSFAMFLPALSPTARTLAIEIPEIELWGHSIVGHETQLAITERVAGPWTFRIALSTARR
jgi:hypothetical protein